MRQPPNVEPIITHVAHWGWDEHQYFGYRVFGELLGQESLTSLMVMSALGRRLTEEELQVIDDAAIALTLSDPRIWPLKLSRALASYGGSLAGLSGGLLAQAESRIGPWTVQKSAEVLLAWHEEVRATGAPLQEVLSQYLREHRFVWGYGTPYRSKDERLVAFAARLRALGRCELPFWRLFMHAGEYIHSVRGAAPNMGMGLAAALLDLGLPKERIGAIAVMLTTHMFLANAVEEAADPSPSLQQLPTDAIEYVGPAPRVSSLKRARGA